MKKTSPLCNGAAIIAGGVVGGAAVSLEWALAVFVEGAFAGAPPGELALVIFLPLLFGIYALPGFIVAMAIIGWPVWAALHFVGFRSWQVAVAAGAAGALIVSALAMAVLGDRSFIGLIWLILPGALASWTVWRLAYGRGIKPPQPQPPAPPS